MSTGLRNESIDAAKGLVMVFVVIGHAQQMLDLPTFIIEFIYSYHMPFFFLLQGYLTRNRATSSGIKNKFNKLLVPHIIFIILIAVPVKLTTSAYHYIRYNEVIEVKAIIAEILFGGQLLDGALTTFWFVPVYFVTGLLMQSLMFIGCMNKIFVLFLFSTISAILSCSTSPIVEKYNVLDLIVVAHALPFSLAGFILRDSVSLQPQHIYMLSIATIIQPLVSVLLPEHSVDLKFARIGVPYLNIASSVIIFLLILKIMQEARFKRRIHEFFIVVGRNNLFIMYAHPLVIVGVSMIYGKMQYQIFGLLAVVLGLFVPLIIGSNLRKNRLSRRYILGENG